jgi:hypothetical protein
VRTATITLRGADFAKKMSEMRVQLDRHSFEPVRFTYKRDREIIVISVDFQEDHHAETFQSRFADRQREAAASLGSAQKQVKRTAGAGLGMPEARGTMAQACWWRLVAEEIRTEADNFGSEAAKETMEMAARGWEQLAEELEHRLAGNSSHEWRFFR